MMVFMVFMTLVVSLLFRQTHARMMVFMVSINGVDISVC